MQEGGLKNRLRLLVALVPLIFPLYFVRLDFYGIPFGLPELVIYILFALWLVTLYWYPPQFKHRPPKTVWVMLLLLVVSVLSLVGLQCSVTFEDQIFQPLMRGLGIWKEWLMAPTLYAILLTQLVGPSKYQLLVRRSFLWGATLLALHALLTGNMAADGRLLGYFSNPNYLALYLAPALWMAGTELSKCCRRDLLEKLVWVLVIGAALFLTRSYAAWLALVVVAVLATVVSFDGRKRWTFVGLLLAGVLMLVAVELGSDKFIQTFDFMGRSSSAVRLEIWRVAWGLWQQHPVLGIGLGNFQLEYLQNAWSILDHAPLEWNVLHTHNLYMHWLTEVGLLGLGTFLVLVILLLRKRSLLGERDMRFVLLVILVQGLIDLPLFKNDLALEFFMVAGLIAAGHHIVHGKVKAGDQVARFKSGYPTVNFDTELADHLDGVYAAWVHWRGQAIKALVFAGSTMEKHRKFEAHLLGVKANFYGEVMDMEIVVKIRETKNFRSAQAIKKQLEKDCKKVEEILS